MVKEFTMVSMKTEEKNVEIQIRDDSTRKETKIILSNVEISSPDYVVGVYDAPEFGREKEARGKDGKTHGVKLAEEQRAGMVSPISRPGEEWKKGFMIVLFTVDLSFLRFI